MKGCDFFLSLSVCEKVTLSAEISCEQKKAEVIQLNQAIEFSVMLTKVAKLLNESVDVKDLKAFLSMLCHPLTGMRYGIELYVHYSTPAEIIEALFPRYIHYLHTDILRQIVNMFGNEQAKTLLKQYEDKFPCKKPLKRMCDPLSDEEIKAFTGTKRMNIKLDANVDTTTMEDVERVQQTISKNTGIDKSMIVYANQTLGSSETSSWDGELALCNYNYPFGHEKCQETYRSYMYSLKHTSLCLHVLLVVCLDVISNQLITPTCNTWYYVRSYQNDEPPYNPIDLDFTAKQ